MLVINGGGNFESNGNSSGGGGGAGCPSVLDSPILARVERAMLRHDAGIRADKNVNTRATYTQSLLPSNQLTSDPYDALKKGLLWQHRDKLFSRWKERYFILTRDYLLCFKRASSADRISEMGQFLFKVKLIDIDRVDWENKKTYSIVSMELVGRDGKIYLRASHGLEDWFELLEECTHECKERKRATRISCPEKGMKDHSKYNSCLDYWIADRQEMHIDRLPTDTVSTRQSTVKRREWLDRGDEWETAAMNNRLSLLTDIDINAYETSTLGSTSVTSYRMNEDVLCIQPPSLRAGMYRMSKESNYKAGDGARATGPSLIKFRERSYSDMQRFDRTNWRANNFK